VKYNVYRGTAPDFVPSAANRVATGVSGPSSYVDTQGVTSGRTYFYVVRAEDNSTGQGGPSGGNEDTNEVRVAGTALGVGIQASPGTLNDGGGDMTSFLRLNTQTAGNTADLAWRFVSSGADPGANHTPNGDHAYRNAGPAPNDNYGSNQCAAAETPVLIVGATSLNLTYWERHQLEKGWDGVAIEYSRNGGPWIDVPAPSNATGDGCMASDTTSDYAALECTRPNANQPVVNACGYPVTKMVITGPSVTPVGECTTYMTAALTGYARRCHRVTGLAVGDTIQFRWRFTSDPGAEFKGFYLDDIAVSNVRLREACTTATPGIPVLAGVTTRTSHGGAGSFDAAMPFNGTGVEPRNANGSYTAVFKFDRPMQSGNVAVVTGVATIGSISFSGNDILVQLSGVTDQQRLTLSATNLTAVGGGVLPSATVTMGFLIGDTTGDGTVNAGDAQQTRNLSGQVAGEANFRSDVNRDGTINSGDALVVRSRSGRSLP
jgi:hypothetical protein